MDFIITMGIIATHLLVGGVTYSKIQARMRPVCRYYPGNCDGSCGHSAIAGLSVVIWPLVLPLLAGVLIGQRESREDRRRRRREAAHMERIEEARRTKQLEREMGLC